MRRYWAWTALAIGAILLAAALSGCAAPGTWFQPSKPTISIAASTTCPTGLGPARDVPDHSDGSPTLMPTSGAPSAVLICTYHNRALAGQSKLGRDAARALESAINNINLAKPTGSFSCPAASSSATILAFQFGHEDDIDLWWSDTGCQTLDNGRLGAFQGANPSFYNEFQGVYTRLVPPTAAPAS